MGKDQDILQAVKDRDVSLLQKLLLKAGKHGKSKLLGSSRRINIDFQDNDGMSALHQAALVGSLEMMGMLLEQGASVGLADNRGMLALHYACWQGKAEPVHMLLQWRSPVNNQSYDGATPLHLACQHGHFDVANLLLLHNAVPVIQNLDHKTPLDLACEFGRYRVVDLLLRSNLCASLLLETPSDMQEGITTCLHLAAKNGHVEIIRLLLQAGMDINRLTQQGTCLHQAALCGKVDVVRLLLDCGVDVNRTNSHNETALDIVLKYTPSRVGKDLKQLLTEASFAVQARAVKDYFNVYDLQSLSFKQGDIIRVLEQNEGLWKGCVITDGRTAKAGYFPPDHVVLIDKSAMMSSFSKKVGMPQVPDLISRNQHVFTTDDGFPPPPPSVFFPPEKDHDVKYISSQYSSYENLNGRPHQFNGDDRSPVPYHLTNDMKTANSISPTNSNRNSAASSDSGRGYSTGHGEPRSPHNYVNVQIVNQHRLSGQSYESGVSSRQSYHSTSSSSVGSLDRLEESGPTSNINVAELFHSGMQDHEILKTWLRDLRYEEYFGLFIQAGYDMRTISRMTPEDLTAIGITKPGHRKRLKAEIARLNISDGLPDYRPNTVEEWLHLLNLEQYYKTLTSQGYADMESVTDISWEDLEEIGISKLGHQKKIMLAVDRLKRIVSNAKRMSTVEGKRGSSEILDPPVSNSPNRHSGEALYSHRPRKSSSGDSINTSEHIYNHSPVPGRQRGSDGSLDSCFFPNSPSSKAFQPDVVAIQVKRQQSSPNSSLAKDMSGQAITYQSFQGPHRRSNEFDRDSTPTEEIDGHYRAPLPMAPVVPKVLNKPKPVAMIVAKTKRGSKEFSPDLEEAEKINQYLEEQIEKSPVPVNGGFKRQKSDLGCEKIYDSPKHSPYNSGVDMSQSCPSGVAGPLHSSTPLKKVPPPPPPKRSNSISRPNTSEQTEENLITGGIPKYGNQTSKPVEARLAQSQKRNSSESQNIVSSTDSSGFAGSMPKASAPKLSPKPMVSTKPVVSPKPQKSVKVTAEQKSFASCVQSLSQKFGSRCGSGSEELVSSDGEDFPPPPPPIAMDIITPKLHNYGIPSKDDKQGEDYRLQYQRQASNGDMKNSPARSSQSMDSRTSHSSVTDNQGAHNDSVSSFKNLSLRTSPSKEPHNVSRTLASQSSVPVSSHNVSSFKNHTGTGELPNSVRSPQVKPKPKRDHLLMENHIGDRERTPPRGGTLKRNDSTSSHDSNISTSSVDSNTLPFANENVGTIKQRAVPAKTSIVQIGEGSNDLNAGVFKQRSETMTASLQKPVIQKPGGKNSEDVLTDIDCMLQGLTDELDAMLEEEVLNNG